MNENDNYIALTPQKKYKKELEIDLAVISVISIVFIALYRGLFSDKVHSLMQLPSMILMLIFGLIIILPASQNKGRKMCEQLIYYYRYQTRKLLERLLKYV